MYNKICLLIAAIALCTACGAVSRVPDLDIKLPSWYNAADEVNKICSVGVVDFNGNLGLSINAATQMARDELARGLKTLVQGYIEVGARDSKVTSGSQQVSASQAANEQLSRGLVKKSLEFTHRKKATPKGGRLYSLVCLNPGRFLKAMKDLAKANDTAAQAVLDQGKMMLKEQGSKLDDLLAKYKD